ncbi:ChaB family protein [Modestobacter roseus]|uniref:ChaB protein n=1 Tax=Modestobacter roseus TaxID=1181884 RepID=A0A562INE9_9ACTN|nr:ChaB family protein [Modestobacter roseus]MQA32479.1 cation transport regulator ChaB [Modestobacter roseus]TWH72255.1 ChaB protein [Modestobacter roseus]
MPKTTKSGDAKQSEIPSTLQRSDEKAQRTFAKAHDSAAESYDDEQRANRVAWGAVKHTHEKVGDHWEPKDHKGPSDEQSAEGNAGTDYDSKGGVDANAAKSHLYDLAKDADIPGRSTMDKDELADALQKSNDRKTAEAREK